MIRTQLITACHFPQFLDLAFTPIKPNFTKIYTTLLFPRDKYDSIFGDDMFQSA